MIKKIALFFAVCLLALTALCGYILYDNNRIVVRTQAVEIDNLPPAFDGFKILQMSDLHSARFGVEQQRLESVLNGLQYDMLAIDGDMVDRTTLDPAPFMELLDHLNNKQIVFYVTGNVGSEDLDRRSGQPSAYGKLLQEHGCLLLDKPHLIVRGGQHIWVTDTYLKTRQADSWIGSITFKLKRETNPDRKSRMETDLAYQKELWTILGEISREEVVIGLTHIPFSPDMLDHPRADDAPIFDLVLAGHYHGGQIRIPFGGAIYIPDPSPDHFFPPEEIVSGFYRGKYTAQFISRGLGASSTVPILKFRLFNPPEVTLVTLTRKPD